LLLFVAISRAQRAAIGLHITVPSHCSRPYSSHIYLLFGGACDGRIFCLSAFRDSRSNCWFVANCPNYLGCPQAQPIKHSVISSESGVIKIIPPELKGLKKKKEFKWTTYPANVIAILCIIQKISPFVI